MINVTLLLCMLGLLRLVGSEMAGCDVITKNESVYWGWPFRISCYKHLHEELDGMLITQCLNKDYDDGWYEEPRNVTCVIIDSAENTTLLDRSADFHNGFRDLYYDVSDFNRTTSINYTLSARFAGGDAACVLVRLVVFPRELPQQTCEQSLQGLNLTTQSIFEKKISNFDCEVSDNVTPTLNSDFIKNLSIVWFKDCKKLPHATQIKYSIHDTTFEHPGTYSCAVMHNGKRWFLNHYKVCVLPESITAKSDIQCSQKTYNVELRGSVTVECWSHVKDPDQFWLYVIDWIRVVNGTAEKMSCKEEETHVEDKDGTRKFCLKSSTTVCHEHVPTEAERKRKNLLLMKFLITDVTEEDFGKHVISLNENGHVTNFTFVLFQDLNQSLHHLSETFGICITSLLFLIALLSILWWRRIYLMVIWKRKFGSCEKDDKRYGAYFVYCFSNALDKFSQQQAVEAVRSVRIAIENLGYKVYDKYKDGDWSGGKGENSLDPMHQCHRLVLILTSQFLKDHWNVFILQEGVRKMVMDGSKLIFILLPGMKEMIKQQAESDDTARMVRRVIKLNGAIEWSDDPKFDSKFFSLFLEHKMPKLESESVARIRMAVTSQTHYRNGFLRSMSSDTDGAKLNHENSIL